MSGPSLIAVQQQFLARIRCQADGDLPLLIAQGRLPGDVGLRIYTHAYGARLVEALGNDHQILGTYLGDELWDRLCRGYLVEHPSHCRSLRDFGAQLPGYLARAEPFRAHPEIAELAAFERQLLDSFDAADDDRATWEQLLALPKSAWPALRLRFHPGFRLHRVARNSVEIWRAIKAGQPPPMAGRAANPHWALWRDVDRVSRFRSTDAEESAAIEHVLGGGDFSGLCLRLLDWYPQAEVPAAALGHLRTWCVEGWLASWEVPPEPADQA